ncbi:adenylate/guanylate cyclase domain-containing protein [Conexibacter woesei]|uniref:adenylate/guanylate cyclase domain-containing protein n=1 Tax=Conexibacter woesei TaxID=191495 RepID=UPI00041B4E49|nr:adenylate/guanylate cyclase domain-containing protein [Conexibacter woesei]
MQEISTQYARSGDLQIAYQVSGDGPLDLVLVPAFLSNIELAWDVPDLARFLHRLGTFARLIRFDRRGSGMSDRPPGAAPLEDHLDDVLAVLDAVGSERAALIGHSEGCALATLFAATVPSRVRAMALMSPIPRAVRGPGYEWAETAAEQEPRIRALLANWGREADGSHPWGRFDDADGETRRALARLQRQSMSPSAAAEVLRMLVRVDVRDVLPTVRCPTLVIRRTDDTFLDPRHSRYAADHIPGARYVEIPGSGMVWQGDLVGADEIQRFLTGAAPATISDRVLATVLFTDIVGSTEHAAALGDGPWRTLLERHDAIVRQEVERHRGRVVKSLGDGALAIFDGPSRAIGSALAIRDAVGALGLEVRAGLHTGECELLPDGDISGLAVHVGTRVSAHAAAGEILVSATVRDLIAGSGRVLADRGEHALKGVPGRWKLYAAESMSQRP